MSVTPQASSGLRGEEVDSLEERLLDLALVDVAALIGQCERHGERLLRRALIADLRDALAAAEGRVSAVLAALGGSHLSRAQGLELAARLERRAAGVAEKLEEALREDPAAGGTDP